MSGSHRTPKRAGRKRSVEELARTVGLITPETAKRVSLIKSSTDVNARALLVRSVNAMITRISRRGTDPETRRTVLSTIQSDGDVRDVILTFPRDAEEATVAFKMEGVRHTPLTLAVELRDQELVETLITMETEEEEPVKESQLTRAGPDGRTPLDYAFSEGANPDIRQFILDTLASWHSIAVGHE